MEQSFPNPIAHQQMQFQAAILIVPGHWHTDFHTQPLINALASRGFEAKSIQQTSVGLKSARPNFNSDVSLITSSILAELENGRDIFLVLHSVAGICGAGALKRVLAAGKQKGKIVHVLLIAAYVFPAGAVMDAATFVGPENPGFSISAPEKLLEMADPAYRFFDDMPTSSKQTFVEALEPTYYLYQGPVITSEYWWKLPATYLLCERDNAVPVGRQEMVSAGLEVVRCNLGHSLFVGHPEVVADVVVGILKKI